MKFIILAGLFIIIAIVISVHQYMMGYPFFQMDDLHHESWIVMFAFAGVVVLALRRG